MDLSDLELEKLNALAKSKNKTPEACIKAFIAACQPGGSGWLPPDATAKKPEKKAEKA